jgi:bacteriorhodopsin
MSYCIAISVLGMNVLQALLFTLYASKLRQLTKRVTALFDDAICYMMILYRYTPAVSVFVNPLT